MLLKVEVYPLNATEPQDPPLYVCLTTAQQQSHHADGIVLTVGRKQGDVMLDKDKTVSRQNHCKLRFVATTNDTGDKYGTLKNRPLPARTPEEVEACHRHPLGMAVVLENESRTGTTVIVEPEPAQKNNSKGNDKDDDSATVDSATDEEGEHSQQQQRPSQSQASSALASQVSPIVQDLVREPAQVQLQAVATPMLLAGLWGVHGRALIQCGKNCSTLVITLQPIRFILTGFGSSKSAASKPPAWTPAQLALIGANELEEWDPLVHTPNAASHSPRRLTHVVTPQRVSTNKQLAAWSLHIPLVVPSFLEAFQTRRSPTDPLPNPNSFCPPDTDPRASFWNQTEPNPFLWNNTTYFSTKANEETEILVTAAGATLVRLYEWEEASHPTQLAQRLATYKPSKSFALDNKRKLTQALRKRGIPLVTPKALAKALTQQQRLELGSDDHDKGEHDDDRDMKIDHTEHTEREEESKARAEPKSKRAETRVELVQNDDPPHKRREDVEDGENDMENQDGTATKKSTATNTTAGRSQEAPTSMLKRKARGGDYVEESSDEEIRPPKRRTTTARSQEGEAELPSGWTSSQRKQPPQKQKPSGSDVSKVDTESSFVIDDSDNNDEIQPDAESKDAESRNATVFRERMSLPVDASSGWMQVLPQGKTRQKYIRTKSEIQETMGYDEVIRTAKTERVAGLLVAQPLVHQTSVSSRRRRTGKPDFKGFRKNQVAGGGLSRIERQYRLTQEKCRQTSQQRVEADEQRQMLEEQQRRADALFRDASRAAANRRRR